VKKHKALENLQFSPALSKHLPAAFAIAGQEICFSACCHGLTWQRAIRTWQPLTQPSPPAE